MTQRVLHLAKDLTLPLDAVTQTIAILAKRRAGKSYTMRRLVEQLFKAAQQVVVVDPKGDQWGIRSAADGKAPGLPIVILGGERGDVPLEASSGEVVAKLVVEDRVSVLLDLSQFRKHEVATFMTAFLENLYRLKAKEIYRTPVMVVIDEADAVAPQKPQKGEERMLGAAEDIVRRGGQRGIGCVLVTQRSAVLNKNVLTQAQMLIVLRTIAPQDLAAMKAWIDVHGDEEQGRILMESLPSLPIGDAWFWSPGWPTVDGIFARVHVLPIETFDSGASPKPGVKPVEPKHLADVDLDALKGQMAATIEKAKADDPRELRKQIADLKKQLTHAPAQVPAKKEPIRQVEKPILTDADSALLNKLLAKIEAMAGSLASRPGAIFVDLEDRLRAAILAAVTKVDEEGVQARGAFLRAIESKGFQNILAKLTGLPSVAARRSPNRPERPPQGTQHLQVSSRGPQVSSARRSIAADDAALPPARQKILNGLAFLHGIGIPSADKTQLALIVGVSPTSGAYANNLGGLRSAGFVEYPTGGTVALTDTGRAIASVDGVPTTTSEMHEAIRAKLPPAKWKILEALIRVYPASLPKDELAARIEVSPTSGAFANNLGSLRSLGLISYPRPAEAAALPVLFLEG